MAEAVVSIMIERLTQSIIQQADRLSGLRVEIRGIEEELELMAAQLERIEALNQLPREYVIQIRDLIYKAEDFIETHATLVFESATAAVYEKPIYWIKQWNSAKELKRIRYMIKDVTEGLSSYVARHIEEEYLPERGSDASIILDQSHVPRNLRRFIYYFLLFPANFEVPTRRLIVLWVAEGLIRPNNINVHESVEHIGERYLNVLINLGVVLVTKKKFNGKVQACLLKDDIRETWLVKAKDANFFQSRRGYVRRVVDHTATETDDASSVRIHGNPSVSHSVSNYGDVISFLSFDTKEGSKPGEDIGDFLHKCILAGRFLWLRVLDLERVFRPKLPKTLGKLIRLKYLGLRSIWRMQDLRQLYLSEAYRTRFPDRPSGVVSLTLVTLWGAFIDEDTCVVQGLDTLLNIRKLGLSCGPRSSPRDSDMPKQLKAVDKWISKLRYLECLRLKSRDKHGKASDLHLSTLEGNRNLSTVYLLGKLNPLVVCKFPESLTEITLSGSKLDMDPMESLERLPNLQILRLLAQSVLHCMMHCSRGGFPQLKVLYVWKLENLEELEVEEGSLPCLEELEIRSCPKLKMTPDGLQHVNTLKKFRLTSMPEGFLEETKVRQPLLWDKIEHVREVE